MTLLVTNQNGPDVTKLANVSGDRFLDRQGGKMRIYNKSYTVPSGGLTLNDIVDLGPIKDGIVLDALSTVKHSAGGAGATLEIGYQEYVDFQGNTVASAIDGFAKAIDVSGAGVGSFAAKTSSAAASADNGITLDGATDLLLKSTGAALPAGAVVTVTLVMAVR